MASIRGQYLRLKLGDKYLAFSRTCTIHLSASVEESSTKDTTGEAQDQDVVSTAWDFSASGLFSLAADANAKNGENLLDLIGTTVSVEFVNTEGDENREVVSGSPKRTGTAIITDVSIEAPNRQDTTYSIQGVGKGALTRVPALNLSN